MINKNLVQPSATARKIRWQRYSKVLAFIGLGLGLLYLLGQLVLLFNNPAKASLGTSIPWHTALSLIIMGGCLLCLHRQWKTPAMLGAFLILLLALTTFAELILQKKLGFIYWILPAFKHDFTFATPSWIAWLNVINLIILAASVLFIVAGWFGIGQLLAAFLFILAYASLIGNFYHIDGLYLAHDFAGITTPTALALAVLSLGLLLYYPHKGWMKMVSSQYSGGMLARYTFNYFLLVAPIFIGFYLYTIDEWELTPGLGILSLFILNCLITLPITFYFLRRLNILDTWLQRTHGELQITNTDLSGRNEELSEALADVKAGNRELAVMTKEALLSSQALEAKNKELLRLNQSLDYIVHMTSHDLKTPVYNLELLLKELKPALEPHMQPYEAQLVTMVGNSIASLKSTIEGLTQIIKSQQLIIGLQVAFSLTKLIQEIKKELEREIAQSNAKIQTHLEVDMVVFSRIHLRSVLLNLFTNALKYRAPDHPLLINIRSEPMPNGLKIIFADNGLGMSAYQVANLFTIYKRFHAHVDGSGIGLYLVKQTIENNGGTIRVESTEGAGTCFTIFLPQANNKKV